MTAYNEEFCLEMTLLLTKYSIKLMDLIDRVFGPCLKYHYQDRIKQYRSLLNYLRYDKKYNEISFHLNQVRLIYNRARHTGLNHYDIDQLNYNLDQLLPTAVTMNHPKDKKLFSQLLLEFQAALFKICHQHQIQVSGKKNFLIEDFIKGKKRAPFFPA